MIMWVIPQIQGKGEVISTGKGESLINFWVAWCALLYWAREMARRTIG